MTTSNENPTFWLDGLSAPNTPPIERPHPIESAERIIKNEDNVLRTIRQNRNEKRMRRQEKKPRSNATPRLNGPRSNANPRLNGPRSNATPRLNGSRVNGPRSNAAPRLNGSRVNGPRSNSARPLTVRDITSQYTSLLYNLKRMDNKKNGDADLQTMKDLVVKLYRYIKDVNETFKKSPEERTKHINQLIQALKANKEFNNKLRLVVALNKNKTLNKTTYKNAVKQPAVISNFNKNISNIFSNKPSNATATTATTNTTNSAAATNNNKKSPKSNNKPANAASVENIFGMI